MTTPSRRATRAQGWAVVVMWPGLLLQAVGLAAPDQPGPAQVAAGALVVASLLGLVVSLRFVADFHTAVLDPAYGFPLVMLGFTATVALRDDSAFVRWAWLGFAALTVLVIIGEYRTRSGRPFGIDHWVAGLSRPRRTGAVMGILALSTTPAVVWILADRDSAELLVLVILLASLFGVAWWSVRRPDEQRGAGGPT